MGLEPELVPNSYIVTKAEGADFDAMIKAIEALMDKEGKKGIVMFTGRMPVIGTAVLQCDATFAAKVASLPCVGDIRPDHILHQSAPRKRSDGPRHF